jgi:HlyD family secretion protein
MKDDSGPQNDMAAVLGMEAPRGLLARLPRLERKWIVAGVAALVLLFLAVRMLGGPAGPKYVTAEITRGGIVATVTATGTLQPVNTVEIGPEISGQIAKVLADFNDKVVAGQVLAVMDTDTLRARVLQSRASLASAKAKVEDARATAAEAALKLARVKDLQARGNASKQDLDTAQAAEARARAAVLSASAQVDVAAANLTSDETTLTKAEIKSPINGIVMSRTVERGQVVAATFQTPVLFKLAEDLTKMELLVDVDEADIGHVQEGQRASFTVDAFQDRQFPATITQVRFAPKTVDSVVTYQAVLAVDNSDLTLRPGMTATASITTATRQDAALMPNAALRFQPPVAVAARGGDAGQPPGLFRMFVPRGMGQPNNPALTAKTPGAQQRVWTLRGGALVPVDIKVGLSDGQRTEIVDGGLKPGDAVVVGQQKAR